MIGEIALDILYVIIGVVAALYVTALALVLADVIRSRQSPSKRGKQYDGTGEGE